MSKSIVTCDATAKHVRPGNLIVSNVRDIIDSVERRAALVTYIECIEFLLGGSLIRKAVKGGFVKQLVARSFYKVHGQPGKYVDFVALLDINIPDINITGLDFIKSLTEMDVNRLYKARRSAIGALRYIRGSDGE